MTGSKLEGRGSALYVKTKEDTFLETLFLKVISTVDG
jgi:hypothetical protein